MKRRDFLEGLTLAAAATLPGLSAPIASEKSSQPAAKTAVNPQYTEHFTSQSRVRSGIALGGIGAGSVELRKNGRFYNWSIFNNLPKETGPNFHLPEDDVEDPTASALFFKVRYEVEGQDPRIALLQLPDSLNEGGILSAAYIYPWMQAVDQIDYSARFPFARMRFTAEDMPFVIELEAWSPFIPHDVKNSSLPLVYFDFKIIPTTAKRVDVMLVMSARNTVGYDTEDRFYTTQILEDAARKTVVMSCGGMDKTASSWGEMTVSSLSPDSTHYTGWAHLHPYYEYVIRNKKLPNLDDTNGGASLGTFPSWMPLTSGRNYVNEATGAKRIRKTKDEPPARLYVSIAKSFILEGNKPIQHSFLLAWNFPNLYAETTTHTQSKTVEGHYYSNFFSNATDVVTYASANRDSLHTQSTQFQQDFFASSIEVEVLEQINSHLNTFITSGRLIKDGSFGILEGLTSTAPWGPIGTIDVMLYGTAPVIALFPELQKSTMRRHAQVQSAQGEIQHGLLKNFGSGEDGTAGVSHRLDLPGQFVILTLRDYFWTGDQQYLREMYPHIQRAIDYVIQHRAPAGNSLPIMRGIESSYDNFPMYGYAAYLLTQWACAMASAVLAAEAMGDSASKAKYEAILHSTELQIDKSLWNGTYYRLYNDTDHAGGNGTLSEGVLTDQIVGQWLAHQSGLGHLLPKPHIDSALRAILKANYRSNFGIKNCSWPGDAFLSPIIKDIWVDQANTCWSGVELALASHLLYEGFREEAVEVIRTVDRRYRKNGLYWDHQEFGGHYFRPMSSWAILNGYLGLGIHANCLRFAPQNRSAQFQFFFATSAATAHYIGTSRAQTLRCRSGKLTFARLEIKAAPARITLRGTTLDPRITPANTPDDFTALDFAQPIELLAGEEIILHLDV